MKQPTTAALYMRLSRDDEAFGDSASIETQRTILRQYAEEHQFIVYDEYVDDGWSGTNFDRPDFQRMMLDAENGKINCIITKDLSRFGREHIAMDYYLEFVFPEKHIRYIAVTEGEDTEKGLSDFVPFKNLFNEWFAKDTSRKVKAALLAKFNAGERTFAYALLGYKRDPDNHNHLIIDEETRWIIERIFGLASLGYGAARITKVLIAEKVPTAGWLNYQRFGTFANIYDGQPEDKAYAWTIAQVKSILKNEAYIGNTIHYTQSNVSFKNKKKMRKAPEEWLRIEHTHEAIISEEQFRQVQEQIASRRREQKNGETQIFAGLLHCADCGWSLSTGIHNGSKHYRYYNCSKYRQLGKGPHSCTSHYLRYDVLYHYVLARIQYWSSRLVQDKEAMRKELLKKGNRLIASETKKKASALEKAQRRQAELNRLFAKLYEDWAASRITEYNFTMLSQKYQAEQQAISETISNLTEAMKKEKQNEDNVQQWIQLLEQYASPQELTAELLNTLIEKIVVHEPHSDEEGNRIQTIEIFYRFIGKIE